MNLKSFFITSTAVITLGFAANAAVLIAVDNTGANLPVDSASSRTWNFTILQSVTVAWSEFSVKAGNSTVDPLVYTLYNNFGGTGDVIHTMNITAAEAGGQYEPASILDFADITLNPGNYSVTMTSTTGTNGNFQYFMKGGVLRLYNTSNRTELSSSNYTADPNTNGTATTTPTTVPEPSSLSVLALTGLLALRRRRA